MSVNSSARYGVCNSSSGLFQINIFTEEVLFCLNITCKTIFILSFKKDFLKLPLGVNKGFYFEEGKNYSHLEAGAYCFEVLARAMIIKFKLTLSR